MGKRQAIKSLMRRCTRKVGFARLSTKDARASRKKHRPNQTRNWRQKLANRMKKQDQGGDQ
jgi:hypothetical protein